MKNIIFSWLLVAGLLFSAVLPLCAGIDEVIFLKDDIAAGNAASYSYEGRLYLNAFQTVRILGGRLDILGASGRVVITAKRSKLLFSESSDNVIINGVKKEYPKPLIVRAGVPFILSQCIASGDFSRTYGKKISFEAVKPENATIRNSVSGGGRSAQEASPIANAVPSTTPAGSDSVPVGNTAEHSTASSVNITGIRCADHEDRTRFVINLSAEAGWTIKRLRDSILIEIQGASAENISSNGIKGREIMSVGFDRIPAGTVAKLYLADTAGRSEIFSLEKPDRIVADVFRLKPGEKILYDSEDERLIPEADSIPAESTVKEEIKETEIEEENIENYPLLRPAESMERTEKISDRSDKKNNTVIKKSNTASGLKMARKDRKGKTVKKTSGSAGKEAVLPAKVLAGLKASGIKYSDNGTEGQKTAGNTVHKNSASTAYGSASSSPSAKMAAGGETRPVAQEGKIIVVLDPAHGGKDEGGPRKFGLSEKQYALHLARDIQKAFADDSRFQVVLTRNTDIFMPLKKRTEIAGGLNASVFISLHANGVSGRPSAKGFEVFSLSDSFDENYEEMLNRENSVTSMESENERPDAASMLRNQKAFELREESARLAGILSSEIARGTPFRNNGVKKSGLTVLRLAEMPSVCIFAGYMTNSTDKQNMDNKLVRMRIARSIYKGVMDYSEMRGWIK